MRWGGKVSVAWPDPGPELGIRERSPSLYVPGFVSGMVLAQPHLIPCPPVYLPLVSGNAG